MSHRTSSLPDLPLPLRFVRELRYHEASRQSAGFLFAIAVTWLGEPSLLWWSVGAPLVLAGTLVRLWASGHVLKNRELATNGPYSWVRHPLYSGNILVLLGFAIGSGLLWAWPVLGFLLWFYYPAAVEYEDRKLRSQFGPVWTHWASRTPALLPAPHRRIEAGDHEQESSWSFRKSLRQNGEPVIALFVLFLYAYLLVQAWS